jgi:hypothetical protein
MTMTLIETKTLGTDQSSVSFTSIPQDGTDLLLVHSAKVNDASISADLVIQFNGDTGANYSFRRLNGTGATATSDTGSSNALFFLAGPATGTTATSNTFGTGQMYIPNYTGTTAKSGSYDGVIENNATSTTMAIGAVLYTGTSAITSLLVRAFSGNNILTGSTFSLYKITKGSDGIVTTTP